MCCNQGPECWKIQNSRWQSGPLCHATHVCATTAGIVYTRPDDHSDVPGLSWRERLAKYVNNFQEDNPFRLRESYRLYKHPAYSGLVQRFGIERTLHPVSAGWGLIRADFLTPAYDITFNRPAKRKPFGLLSHLLGITVSSSRYPRNNKVQLSSWGAKTFSRVTDRTAATRRGIIRAGKDKPCTRATQGQFEDLSEWLSI